ncbi:RNA polymerase sigma factor sigC [Populus alba x Populus x berolinensis]|uniref:RNA polymerase sigma factor sigC n=1 Tax=Populus alba x Populus x berolinensis TaxID=444605 RepID=A0AAD6W0Q9_9ROSI|nr:RNA polymerase sigma factor sigC [Populus alba x Populus x berolinensis]
MGVGFRLTPKWGSPMQSHSVTNSTSMFSSFSARGMEASVNQARLSFLSVVSEEGDILNKHSFKSFACSSAAQNVENDCLQMERLKMNVDKTSHVSMNNMMGNDKVPVEEEISTSHTRLRERTTSRFSFLLDNLDTLEKLVADLDALKLERDILLQLGRLGALEFFNACLSRSLQTSNVLDLSAVPTENTGESKTDGMLDDHTGKPVVRTRKKEERKFRRERAAPDNEKKTTSLSLPSKTVQNNLQKPTFVKRTSSSSSRRSLIARNEAKMTRGVKVASDLERIRTTLEKETGQVVSLSCWAEATGLDKKVLQQQLQFGWYCRDELIKNTHSLVLYIARNYRGMGIAMEDLILFANSTSNPVNSLTGLSPLDSQLASAGNLGVLQGAERFDPSRGYRFSTYVQYWIRKSMLKIVERHARGIQIPYALSRSINKIQKARKALSNSHGRYPDDWEVAKFTGLSLAKIESAKKCLRVVASLDQKIGEGHYAKYSEFIPDMSIQNPEEAVTRQHMREEIYDLLRGLDSRERQVMVLRYGFKDNQPKSLAEIGRLFHVSKERVRKIEKKIMIKLRDEGIRRNLSRYVIL